MAAFQEVKGWAEDLVDKLWDVEQKLVDLCSDETSARLLMKLQPLAKVYERILMENNKYGLSEDGKRS